MDRGRLILDAQDFLLAVGCAMPRILGMFAVLPIFASQLMPRLLSLSVAAAFAALVAPTLVPVVHDLDNGVRFVLTIGKEMFVGFILGYAVALPFWVFEAIGALIDNQRGATISATLNPLTGDDTSPLGILFNQAFIVFFFACGGFLLMLGMLYDSYAMWPVFGWSPNLRAETLPLLLGQLDRMVRLTMLLAAPVVVAMFLAELGLALVSRFVPQLQVFFLAMPIKSALAMLVLAIYAVTLFDAGRASIMDLRNTLPLLREHMK